MSWAGLVAWERRAMHTAICYENHENKNRLLGKLKIRCGDNIKVYLNKPQSKGMDWTL